MTDDVRFATMISKMAHELRSPLTAVKGFASTLMMHWDRFTDEQRREFITAVHGDAERMSRIVTEVLDIARAEAGRMELHLSRFPVFEVVNQAVSSLEGLPGAERIVVDVDEGLSIRADRDRILYIVRNLLENAARFSQEGSIHVTAGETGEDAVELSVSDEGIGIDGERLVDLFEGPGPTGQIATPRGTGYGLYLAKRVLALHDATITVESEPDKGSTFRVVLPKGSS